MRREKENTMMFSHIKGCQSFLSTDVKILVKAATPGNESAERKYSPQDTWVTPGGIINWNRVHEALSGIKEMEESEAWFQVAVSQLLPLVSQSHTCLKELHVSGHYRDTVAPWLNWTGQEKMLLMCVHLLYDEECEADRLLALLVVTAITERVLGDLVWKKRKQVPFLLRDLLLTPDLGVLFGVTRILVLRVLLGSVFGLNLRNLAWHGFLTPGLVHPAFTATLVIILSDCGRCLQASQDSRVSTSSLIPTRLMVSLQKGECLGTVFKDIPMEREMMEEIVEISPFVPSVMAPVWQRVFQLFLSDRYGFGLTLLLPVLECSLRCLFAMANRSPHRLLTAQTSAFYTTLDQILYPLATVQEYDFLDLTRDCVSSEITKNNRKESLIMCDTSQNSKNEDETQNQAADNHPELTESNCIPKRKETEVLDDHEIQKQGDSQQEPFDSCYMSKKNGTQVSDGHETRKQTTHRQPGLTEANHVLPVIGRKINEALHDLFNFIQGPRVRDRISHGEVTLQNIPPELAHHVLCLSLLILSCSASTKTGDSDSCWCGVENVCENRKPFDFEHFSEGSKSYCKGGTENTHSPNRKLCADSSSCFEGVAPCKSRYISKSVNFHSPSKSDSGSVTSCKCSYESEETGACNRSNYESSFGITDHTENRYDCKEQTFDWLSTEQHCVCEIMVYPSRAPTKLSDKTQQYVTELRRCIGCYKVKYHQNALLHTKLTDCFSLIEHWMSWKRVDITDLEYEFWTNEETFEIPGVLIYHPLKASHKTVFLDNVAEILEEIRVMDYQVLYRPKAELEVVSLLYKIACNIHTALENMQENLSVKYLQFVEKRLRSRQRETYRRQLNSVPRIVMNLFISSQVVYLFFSSVHRLAALNSGGISVLVKLLRAILKVQENVVSYTNLSTNRWEEALCISEENIELIKENFAA